MLVEGRAVLEVAGRRVSLSPGDYLVIPAHTPHRVLETHPEPRCLWLAVHLYPAGTARA
jgi:cupin 2 domain-containing protein